MRYFNRNQIDRAFEARSVAVVGAKKLNGYFWFRQLATFPGTVSSVHVNPESIRDIEALGVTNYARLGDVPGPVDYVIVNTPRRMAVDIFEQCIEAKVGAVAYFTSGFAETDDEGRELQRQLAALSRESGVALFGPNCMGVYNPARGMCSAGGMPVGESGPVGMVSQSGTHAGYFAKTLFHWHGIREARGISFGNAAVLDAADWIEYIGQNDQVEVLTAYLEGIGDREAGDYDRFAEALAAVTARKPVVIWKGGNSADGARVTRNHTGAAAVSPEDWAYLLDRTGAIGVESMEALVDTTASLVKLRPARGPRLGVLILTGGQGIALTDTFARNGLRVPELSQSSLDELATFFDPIGGSYHNPLDAAYATETPALLERELGILDRDPNIDAVVMDLFQTIMSVRRIQSDYGVGQGHRKDLPAPAGDRFLDVLVRQARTASKPFFVVLTPAEAEREGLELRDLLKNAGVLSFDSAERAATAYAKALRWWALARR